MNLNKTLDLDFLSVPETLLSLLKIIKKVNEEIHKATSDTVDNETVMGFIREAVAAEIDEAGDGREYVEGTVIRVLSMKNHGVHGLGPALGNLYNSSDLGCQELVFAAMYAAANINIGMEEGDPKGGFPFVKRDFIRAAVLAYDLAAVMLKEVKRREGDIPKYDH